jgi:hypothetical protein
MREYRHKCNRDGTCLHMLIHCPSYIDTASTGWIFIKFDIGDSNNVANINVSSYSTIDKIPTGATLLNKLVNCLKICKLFLCDVKIFDYVYLWFICGYIAYISTLQAEIVVCRT